MTLTPEKLAELREKAKAAESFTAGKPWSYDEEAADVHSGIRERGKHILDYGASFVVCDPAMKDDNMDRVDAFGRHIAAADPQTVLALVEEVERLRRDAPQKIDPNNACRWYLNDPSLEAGKRFHICGKPTDGFDALCAEHNAKTAVTLRLVEELRAENAKVTDARDDLLDEVGRLRSMEATLQAIVRDLNEARGDGGSKLGIGGAYGAVVSLIGENARWMEECYHQQAKAERLQARVAELEAQAPEREVGS